MQLSPESQVGNNSYTFRLSLGNTSYHLNKVFFLLETYLLFKPRKTISMYIIDLGTKLHLVVQPLHISISIKWTVKVIRAVIHQNTTSEQTSHDAAGHLALPWSQRSPTPFFMCSSFFRMWTYCIMLHTPLHMLIRRWSVFSPRDMAKRYCALCDKAYGS